jgi:hypothetical protein
MHRLVPRLELKHGKSTSAVSGDELLIDFFLIDGGGTSLILSESKLLNAAHIPMPARLTTPPPRKVFMTSQGEI